MDISDTVAPKSDQLDFDDMLPGERTFTIREVRKGPSADQPVEIVLDEFPRPWRPAKSMRRVLIVAWGTDASKYIGRKVTLFGDPTVKFGGAAVGGTRIRALSHIPESITVALTVTRGKRAPYVVQPIVTAPEKDTSGRDWLVELADTDGDLDAIKALGGAARASHASETILGVILTAYNDAKATEAPTTI